MCDYVGAVVSVIGNLNCDLQGVLQAALVLLLLGVADAGPLRSENDSFQSVCSSS